MIVFGVFVWSVWIGGGGLGSTFQKSGKFHELSRKSIKKIYSGVGVKKSKVREMS